MLQDRLEALMLVSFEKDILLALLTNLHEGCIVFNQLKLFAFSTYFFQIYIKLLSPEAVFYSKIQPKRWRLGLCPEPAGKLVALSPILNRNLVHASICQTFAKFTLIMTGNTRKTFWRPVTARTRWGSLQRSQDT